MNQTTESYKLSDNISYTLQAPIPSRHYLRVNISIQGKLPPVLHFSMPSWSPGHYRIFDFIKHMVDFKAYVNNKTPLLFERITKNSYKIYTEGHSLINLSYDIYAHNLSGTFSWLSEEGALINLPSVLMYSEEFKTSPVQMKIDFPESWDIACDLALQDRHYNAADYQELIDYPILAGDLLIREKQINGCPVRCVYFSPLPIPGEHSITQGIFDITQHAMKILPIPEDWSFSFFYGFGLSPGAFNAMEHIQTSLITDNAIPQWPYQIDRTLRYSAHELFHYWNIKTVRPREYMNYDLNQEQYSPSLWIVEGFTQYMELKLLAGAGLISKAVFRDYLSNYITLLENNYAAHWVSLVQSSITRWIYSFADEENDRDRGHFSYYTRGAVFAFLLDVEMLKRTQNRIGMEQLFNYLYNQFYRKNKGYSLDEFIQAINTITASDFSTFFQEYARYNHAFDYDSVFNESGFKLSKADSTIKSLGFSCHGNKIIEVEWNSEAEKMGLQRGDIIKKIDNRAFYSPLEDYLADYNIGMAVNLIVERFNTQRQLQLNIKTEDKKICELSEITDSSLLKKTRQEYIYFGKPTDVELIAPEKSAD